MGPGEEWQDALEPSDPPEIEATLWTGWGGELAFDVGSRRGENIRHLRDAGFTRIIALEPERSSFAALIRRFADVCTPLNIAVSDRTGDVELAQVPGAIAKGELVSAVDGMEWSASDWSTVPTVRVSCRTMDDLAEEYGVPGFGVVDTEGHEVRVLEGGTGLLTVGKTGFLVEFHSPENRRTCMDVFEDYGYDVETVRHPHYRPYSPMWHQHGWLRAVAPNGPQS